MSKCSNHLCSPLSLAQPASPPTLINKNTASSTHFITPHWLLSVYQTVGKKPMFTCINKHALTPAPSKHFPRAQGSILTYGLDQSPHFTRQAVFFIRCIALYVHHRPLSTAPSLPTWRSPRRRTSLDSGPTAVPTPSTASAFHPKATWPRWEGWNQSPPWDPAAGWSVNALSNTRSC